MKIRNPAFVLLMVALLVAAMYAPVTKAEENTSGTALKYKFTEGETRRYRYTATIADGDSLNAKLIMNLTVRVVGASADDGMATVEVKPSLISFKATAEGQKVELESQLVMGGPDSPEDCALRALTNSLAKTRTVQVDSLGRVEADDSMNSFWWHAAMKRYPELFCGPFNALVLVHPAPQVLPFWVQYPEKLISIGDKWETPYDSLPTLRGINCTWILREISASAVTIERMPGRYQLYLSMGTRWGEDWLCLAASHDEEEFVFKPKQEYIGPVVRRERCGTGARITVDPATGWITRYESVMQVSGWMTVRKPGLLQKKTETTVDSTVTTVLEPLQP